MKLLLTFSSSDLLFVKVIINIARAENFWMVDIEINAWSPIILNLQIK